MIESWIQECSELAPYLKEKLAGDKDHTWATAPYIHPKVRTVIAEHEPSVKYAHLGYIPQCIYFDGTPYFYPWTPGGGGGGVGYGAAIETWGGDVIQPYPAAQYSRLTAQAHYEAEIRQQEQLLENQIQTILNTPLISNYKEFYSRIYF